jgi:hypothetical protein
VALSAAKQDTSRVPARVPHLVSGRQNEGDELAARSRTAAIAFGCRHSGRLRSRTCFCPSGVGAQLLAAHVEQRGAVAADHDLLTILRNVREEHTPAQELLEQFGGCARGFTRRRVDMGAHRPSDPLFPFTTGRLGSDVLTAGGVALIAEKPREAT